MKVKFEFKVFSQEYDEDGLHKIENVKYFWNVPEQVEKETICYFFANQYGINTKQAEDIMDEWLLYEPAREWYEMEYNDDVEEYIAKNYKCAAFDDYKKEV